ncbi:hypothetical protein HK104_009147 [Borealophlyctis nickersoniae]|nr:hypothetical protein HK104_009147 [Borealophlyctis nickersoniae]
MTLPAMPKRHLGRNGPLVSAIGLGCMGMSEFYGQTDEQESLRTLNRAIDLGCTFWDTSDAYGVGANERLLAKVLATRRAEVFLCTKFGICREPGQPYVINGSKEYVKSACSASLQRLEVDCIDLYYLHRVDLKTPIEETVSAMAELVKEGKVKYLGLSECSAETLRKAHAVHPIAAVQVEYSPWSLDIEQNNLLATARELGVSIVAYSPLGRGFLTGRYKSLDDFEKDDYRRSSPRFAGDNFAKNLTLVEKFNEMAKAKGCTAGQLALAWVLKQGEDFIPIPGTKRVKYLEENIGSAAVTVTDQDDAQIREIIKSIGVSGDRYTEAGMKLVNV